MTIPVCLLLEDGIGADRSQARFPRVGHGLKRLVVIGSEDDTVGSGERLAAMLRRASSRLGRGDHVQAGLSGAFGDAVAEFVDA